MNILIIGGTEFVGRHLTETALTRRHTVTLFNRGKTNPNVLTHDNLNFIQGDRETDIANLGERKWDAVIDTCGYLPRIVGLSADYLQSRVKQYCFISTISVYEEDNDPYFDEENGRLIILPDPTVETIDENYGGLKFLCEQVVNEKFPNALHIRPGLIVGPYDPTNRFVYWPRRAAQGGRMLAPEPKAEPIQLIDARDLATFTIHALEQNLSGIFNAAGQTDALTWQEMVETCVQVCNPETEIVWADETFLKANGIDLFTSLPLWLGSEMPSFSRVSVKKAVATGLNYRPFSDTVKDTLAWDKTITPPENSPFGISSIQEKALLKLINH